MTQFAFVFPGQGSQTVGMLADMAGVKVGHLRHHPNGTHNSKRCGNNFVRHTGHHVTAAGIDFIRLTTPTTDDGRLPTVLAGSSGFVYYVSVAGVTGAGSATTEQVSAAIERLRRHTDLPISVGFGIRTPEQAAAIARLADGVVVGSALIDKIENAATPEQAVDGVLSLCAALAEGVRNAR